MKTESAKPATGSRMAPPVHDVSVRAPVGEAARRNERLALMALAYAAESRRLPQLIRRPLIWGGVYGVGLYGVMNGVVLPLSAVSPRPTFPPPHMLSGIAAHIAFVGIPIALIAARLLRRS